MWLGHADDVCLPYTKAYFYFVKFEFVRYIYESVEINKLEPQSHEEGRTAVVWKELLRARGPF